MRSSGGISWVLFLVCHAGWCDKNERERSCHFALYLSPPDTKQANILSRQETEEHLVLILNRLHHFLQCTTRLSVRHLAVTFGRFSPPNAAVLGEKPAVHMFLERVIQESKTCRKPWLSTVCERFCTFTAIISTTCKLSMLRKVSCAKRWMPTWQKRFKSICATKNYLLLKWKPPRQALPSSDATPIVFLRFAKLGRSHSSHWSLIVVPSPSRFLQRHRGDMLFERNAGRGDFRQRHHPPPLNLIFRFTFRNGSALLART